MNQWFEEGLFKKVHPAFTLSGVLEKKTRGAVKLQELLKPTKSGSFLFWKPPNQSEMKIFKNLLFFKDFQGFLAKALKNLMLFKDFQHKC